MESIIIFLEMMLGLFLILSGYLFVRTFLQEVSLRHRHEPEQGAPPPEKRASEVEEFMLDRNVVHLRACGLTPRQIAALLQLKKWYEAEEGDHAAAPHPDKGA